MVIWGLWQNRNFFIHEKKKRKPEDTLASAVSFLLKFQQDSPCAKAEALGELVICTWKPPGVGWYKANFDEAYRKNGKAGIGVVIRDDLGHIIASYIEYKEWMVNVEVTEPLGGYHALEITNSLGLKKIHLEGDALTVIRAIKSQEADKSYI
ncbi:hypothetical protein U1Q18_007768 [Sarracenia purpurea var. burkii]